MVVTEAMRDEEVAVLVLVNVLKRSPVPMPVLTVPVALWKKLATSTMELPLMSEWLTVKAGVAAREVEALERSTLNPPPKKPLPPTLRLDLTKTC